MDYEKKYKEALERAKKFEEKYGGGYAEYIFPELAESEDERIRKGLVKLLTVAGEAYVVDSTGIKKDSYLAYLEKQKEQKPVEPSDDELQRHQDELYNFKVFAAKQAKEHHISFVHDFEWNNFCAELLSYFNEQKPAWSEEDERMIGRIRSVVNECASYNDALDVNGDYCEGDYAKLDAWLKSLRPRLSDEEIKKIRSEEYTKGFNDAAFGGKIKEWSVEDEDRIRQIERIAQQAGCTQKLQEEIHDWLKSLRPSWKPSEGQMKALEAATVRYQSTGLESLFEDLKKL